MSINERVLVSPVMSGTDATDSAVVIWPYTEKGTITRAYIANLTAVSADNSNNITVTATQNSQDIFSRQTDVAGGALSANASEAQTILAALDGEERELDTGDAVTFAVAKAGTGPAYELSVVLVYKLLN